MKISIIIPVYNTKEYLPECLDSILTQGFEDYEVIIVDDGSTDGSLDVIKKYCDKYNNVKLMEQRNSGASSARNNGLLNSSGEYVLFVDSDDFLHKNSLSNLYTSAHSNNADIVISQRDIYKKNKHFKCLDVISLFCSDVNVTNVRDQPLIRKIIAIHGKLFRKSFLLESSLTFPEGMSSEDFIFTYKSYALTDKISICKELTYSYRKRDGDTQSITQQRLSLYNIQSRFRQMKETLDLCRLYSSLNIGENEEMKLNYNSRLPRHISSIVKVDENSSKAFEAIRHEVKSSKVNIFDFVNEKNKARYHLILNGKVNELALFNRYLEKKKTTFTESLKFVIKIKSLTVAKVIFTLPVRVL